MNKATLIQALGSVPPSRGKVLVEDQTVRDIIEAMQDKHLECRKYYDTIFSYFVKDSLYNTCAALWEFCKDNFTYDVEGLDDQRVSMPSTMLKRGHNDCKGYSLFIGGVLDAMKRAGVFSFTWVFRYIPSSLLSGELGHVFVVVNPRSDNIWIDPVMENFNQHYFYLLKKDNNVSKASQVGRVSYGRGGVGALSTLQNGGYYGQLVFNNQNLIPGAGAAYLADPPVTFWLNGAQLVLPPPNLSVGAAVPPLPVGLRVQYAPSFMGYPVPANMPRPVVASGNRLQIAPLELGATGDQTNAMLTANNKVLLNLLMSAMGSLINAYSSRPYSNPSVNGPGTSGAFNDLSQYILQLRNKDNFLDPQVEKTFAGEVISDIANTVLPVVELVAPTVVNAVVPGAGTALKYGLQAEDSFLKGKSNTNVATNVLPASAPGAAPVTVGGIPLWVKIAAAGTLLYFLID